MENTNNQTPARSSEEQLKAKYGVRRQALPRRHHRPCGR